MRIDREKALQFSEVYIEPQFSNITSRSLVKTDQVIKAFQDIHLSIPVISANMDTVTDAKMAIAMYKAGGIGAIHRFMSIEENVAQYFEVENAKCHCFVSVGVNEDSKARTTALVNAGARLFVVDIAHGHSAMMQSMVSWMRETFPQDLFIMAGNVATHKAMDDLVQWGVDAVKIGIGPGAVCTTKNVTGVTVPQFTAISNVCDPQWFPRKTTARGNKVLLVADGGVQEIGDIAKALGAGADLVMCGRMFANCHESPGPRINGKKIYRGMASRDAMLTIRDESGLPTPEGISTLISEPEETVSDVMKHIKGGLQSSFSYSNAKSIQEFHDNVVFGVRT